MPLCHWPCSCYPNHAFNQVNDWMAEIYERWALAHGVLIATPVHWYQASSVLKLMMDRLVCADGGNPDPSSTHGKKVEEAKALEMQGWPYPKHLAGRAYGLIVHGDVAGIEGVRRALSDWLDWMGLIDAGPLARLDRFVGYYEPYATSHDDLDRDTAVQEETRHAAQELVAMVRQIRGGILGGISTGQDIVVTIGIKPTSSIRVPRRSIDKQGNPVTVETNGRHDPCVGIRATPIAEAMVALVLMDHALLHRAQNAAVETPTPKIAGSVKKTGSVSKSKPVAKLNPDPNEA